MSRHTIVFKEDLFQEFVPNSKRSGSEYSATIQNLTDRQITIKVTNGNIQSNNCIFELPNGLTFNVDIGKLKRFIGSYDGWLITTVITTNPITGNVLITDSS